MVSSAVKGLKIGGYEESDQISMSREETTSLLIADRVTVQTGVQGLPDICPNSNS
jgi:hypothetical protein